MSELTAFDFYTITCTECKRRNYLLLGHGPNRLTLNGLMSDQVICSAVELDEPMFDEEILDDLMYIQARNLVMLEDWLMWGYYCSDCRRLENKLDFVIVLRSGEFYVPEYHCKSCGGILMNGNSVDIIKETRCKFCGGIFDENIIDETID